MDQGQQGNLRNIGRLREIKQMFIEQGITSGDFGVDFNEPRLKHITPELREDILTVQTHWDKIDLVGVKSGTL